MRRVGRVVRNARELGVLGRSHEARRRVAHKFVKVTANQRTVLRRIDDANLNVVGIDNDRSITVRAHIERVARLGKTVTRVHIGKAVELKERQVARSDRRADGIAPPGRPAEARAVLIDEAERSVRRLAVGKVRRTRPRARLRKPPAVVLRVRLSDEKNGHVRLVNGHAVNRLGKTRQTRDGARRDCRSRSLRLARERRRGKLSVVDGIGVRRAVRNARNLLAVDVDGGVRRRESRIDGIERDRTDLHRLTVHAIGVDLRGAHRRNDDRRARRERDFEALVRDVLNPLVRAGKLRLRKRELALCGERAGHAELCVLAVRRRKNHVLIAHRHGVLTVDRVTGPGPVAEDSE